MYESPIQLIINEAVESLEEKQEKYVVQDKLVSMRYKYAWETKWTYSNELLMADFDLDKLYYWDKDWYEGQEDIEILGCISINDIEVPQFGGDAQ